MATSKKSLKMLSKSELQERLDRQIKLLSNKAFIAKLPDKGEKIQHLKSDLEKLLFDNERASQNEVASMVEIENSLQKLKIGRPKTTEENQDLDSYDDDKSELVANGTSDRMPVKDSRILENAETFFDNLTEKIEPEGGKPEHFLYHFRMNRELRSTRTTDLPPAPPAGTSQKMWYETAVTPPPSKFDEVKLISLKDSFDLTKRHNEKIKELAIEQVAGQLSFIRDGHSDSYRTQYRESAESQSSEED